MKMVVLGKKILYIIAQQNFRDEEYKTPKEILEGKGAQITTASITTNEARGMLGLRVKPDIAVRDANPNNFDALIIAGGSGSPKLADYPEVLNIVRRFNEQNKLIAAICVAPYILAKAGIINGVNVTTYPADFVLVELRRAGAVYIRRSVVVDGKIITADGPQSAREFGEKIVEILSR
jgi:protease I